VHASAIAQMRRCVDTYLSRDRRYRVVDFGSRISDGQRNSHREVFAEYDVDYVGVDIDEGRNVDVVMKRPYKIPLRANSVDVVISGQVFEHIPFFWASFLELARILRPGGLIFLTVPSRGHTHDVYDCWRIYPDGLRAVAAMSRLELLEGRTDFPPTTDGRRFDYGGIDRTNAYWGDTVGVFRKPKHYPDLEVRLFRTVAVWWGNRIGDLSGVPGTDPRHPGRRLEPPPARSRRDLAAAVRQARRLAGRTRRRVKRGTRRLAGRARRLRA
jgi:SAM-dependent methyltransferase